MTPPGHPPSLRVCGGGAHLIHSIAFFCMTICISSGILRISTLYMPSHCPWYIITVPSSSPGSFCAHQTRTAHLLSPERRIMADVIGILHYLSPCLAYFTQHSVHLCRSIYQHPLLFLGRVTFHSAERPCLIPLFIHQWTIGLISPFSPCE